MIEITVETLTNIINAETSAATRGRINGVTTDSRNVRTGDCFFAIKGPTFDGHDYIEQALEKGACCVVVSRSPSELSAEKPVLQVPDTVKALGELARWYRKNRPFRLVAITGSVGKTTTRGIIYHVLGRHFRVHQSPANFNNEIGLPLTLLGAEPEDELIIAELGANRPGEIAYLTGIAEPDIAVVNNVRAVHLEGFINLENIKREKLSIVKGLRENGVLVVNAELQSDLPQQNNFRTVTFGNSSGSSVYAENVKYRPDGTTFTLQGTELFLPLLGPGNLDNALAAWSVCRELDVNLSEFAEALESLPGVPMRAELLRFGSVTVLNDCYNASPASMKNALAIVESLAGPRGRKIFICGEMAELGPDSENMHVRLGKDIVDAHIDTLLAVGPKAGLTARAAQDLADYDIKVKYFDDAGTVSDKLADFIENNDIVLVKGSRIASLEKTVEKMKALFDTGPLGPSSQTAARSGNPEK